MTTSSQTPPPGHDHDAPDSFTHRLGESAQQVWLAGLGAFNRAQSEGSRLFESLVRDGQAYEQRSKAAGASGWNVQDNLAAGLGQARERGARTWDKVEHAFDEQVQAVLRRLNMPTAAQVAALETELAALRQRLAAIEAQQARTAAGNAANSQ
ncbi:MAG: phasin family protein [Stenotrophomonas sp.]